MKLIKCDRCELAVRVVDASAQAFRKLARLDSSEDVEHTIDLCGPCSSEVWRYATTRPPRVSQS